MEFPHGQCFPEFVVIDGVIWPIGMFVDGLVRNPTDVTDRKKLSASARAVGVSCQRRFMQPAAEEDEACLKTSDTPKSRCRVEWAP